jgi:hypothetical protein
MSDEFAPDAPLEPAQAPEAPQIDPRAAQLWDGLNNMDRRPDTLNQVLRPGVDLPDGMDWQTARSLLFQQQNAPAEEEQFDPFEEVYGPQPQVIGYDPQGQPVYDQPYQQQQGFDPRDLAPVFDQFGARIQQQAVDAAVERVKAEFMQQAQEQALNTGLQQASSKHNLTDFDQTVVRSLTQQAQQQGDRRSPSEIADSVAQQYLAAANQRFVAQGGVAPVQGQAAPGGMVPGEQQLKTDADAIAFSRSALQRPQ